MLRIVVTGSRTINRQSEEFIFAVLDNLPLVKEALANKETIFLGQGGAKGADLIASEWAGLRGYDRKVYPAEWKRHGRAAGPIRNAEMLREHKPDVVLAFIDKPLDESKGTKSMVGKAMAEPGVKVWVWDVLNKRLVASNMHDARTTALLHQQ